MVEGYRTEWKSHEQLVEALNNRKKGLRRKWEKAAAPRKAKIAAKMLQDFLALADVDALGGALAAIAWKDQVTIHPKGKAALTRTFLRVVVNLNYRRAAAIATAIEKVGGPKGAAKKIADNHGFDSTVWESATRKGRRRATETLPSALKRIIKSRNRSKPKSK